MATSPAVAAKPAAAPASVPTRAADRLTGYYRAVRQMNLQLAKDRYKQGFKVRTQEYIRGRGTLAVVDEEICMGCTHCFDNCAFESIGMVDRKFALPEYSYTSRKAIIIEENCVGCEKCAIVCPVDAITMVTKHGFEVKDGRVVSTTPAAPLASGHREGPQGAADDVQAGNPDDQEPPPGRAVDRDHEDHGGLPRRDRTRRDRDRRVLVDARLHPARRVRFDAPDPHQDRGLHRLSIAARSEPGDLPEMRRSADVRLTARPAAGRRARCRL